MTQLVVFWTPSSRPCNSCLCKICFSEAPSFVLRSPRMEIYPFIKLEWVMQSLTSTSHFPRSSAKPSWELGQLHFGTGYTWSQHTAPTGLLCSCLCTGGLWDHSLVLQKGHLLWGEDIQNKTPTWRSSADSVSYPQPPKKSGSRAHHSDLKVSTAGNYLVERFSIYQQLSVSQPLQTFIIFQPECFSLNSEARFTNGWKK